MRWSAMLLAALAVLDPVILPPDHDVVSTGLSEWRESTQRAVLVLLRASSIVLHMHGRSAKP